MMKTKKSIREHARYHNRPEVLERDRLRISGLRACSKCGEEKPATTEFFYPAETKGGWSKTKPSCRECGQKSRYDKRAARIADGSHKPWSNPLINDGMRHCRACEKWKPATLEFFYSKRDSDPGSPAGLTSQCRECVRSRTRTWSRTHPEQRLETMHKWRSANPNKVAASRKRERFGDRAGYIERSRAYNASVRESTTAKSRERYKTDAEFREKSKIDSIRYRAAHKDAVNANKKAWAEANRDKVRASALRSWRRRIEADIGVRINGLMSHRMNELLKVRSFKGKGGQSWKSLVGYGLEDLHRHLERQFTNGMTWKNMGKGGWHIDHIIALKHFHFTSVDDPEFKAAWALTNLRPLWERDNLTKGAKRTLLL